MLDGRHQDVLGIYQILFIIRQHSNFYYTRLRVSTF